MKWFIGLHSVLLPLLIVIEEDHNSVYKKTLDSKCVLIGLQVCFHGAMKHENDVSNMIGCLQVVRIYSFMKEIKVNIRASYIVFLFVKTENNNFI